jgi:phospholipase C
LVLVREHRAARFGWALDVMPTQESGRKPARPLPFQPNVNLVDFGTDANGALVASLELSNVASFVTKARHFSV